jgi:hypothetical protein
MKILSVTLFRLLVAAYRNPPMVCKLFHKPEIILKRATVKLLFPNQNYNVLSPSSYTHISVRDLYISRIGLPILLQGNMWTCPGNI